MNLFLFTIFLLSTVTAAAHLKGRQACYQDNCLRAVNGTQRGQSHPFTAFKNCTDYMTTTILEDSTTTTKTETLCFTNNPTASDFITPSPTPSLSRAQMKRRPHLEARATTTTAEVTHGIIPYYATSACDDDRYSSACSCIGVEPATITQASYTVTRTITVPTTDLTNGCKSELSTSTTRTSLATTSSNSTTSSTFKVTLSFNLSTTTTVITLTSISDVATGTIYSRISSSTTPPWLNSTTTSFPSSSRSTFTYWNVTNPYNATSAATCTACTTVTTTLANATISVTSSSSLNSTISYNATSTIASTTETASSTSSDIFPTPTICDGATVELCSGTCSNLSTDVRNCGVCDNNCTPGHTCTNGVCTRPPCDSKCLEQKGCGPANSTCVCGLESGGAGVCFQGSGLCNNFDNCAVTADCGLGFVCVLENCCGRGKCLNTEGCGTQGSLRLGLGSIRRVKEFESAKVGEMNLLGGYLV